MNEHDRSRKYLIGMPAPDSLGGPIASEPPFVEALREKGLDTVTEVYVYGDKLEPTPFFERVRRVLKTAFRFRKLVRKHRPALIFLNSAFDRRTVLRDAISIFVISSGAAKVFVKLHGSTADDLQHPGPLFRILIGYLQRKVDGWGYFTREELDSFVKLGFDPGRFFPVRNAIDLDREVPTDFTREQRESGEIFELLFVSRFVRTKGLMPTIYACEVLRKRGLRFRLTCVGDGESRREAEDAVGRLGLGRVVRFTGHLPEAEVTKQLLKGDILLFPTSHPEGFPMVLFKAVATGLPVVTTKIRAAADYLSEPENCLHCTTDPRNIAARIEELIADKALRERMSQANLAYGRTLTPTEVADEFIDIFDELLGDQRPKDTN